MEVETCFRYLSSCIEGNALRIRLHVKLCPASVCRVAHRLNIIAYDCHVFRYNMYYVTSPLKPATENGQGMHVAYSTRS